MSTIGPVTSLIVDHTIASKERACQFLKKVKEAKQQVVAIGGPDPEEPFVIAGEVSDFMLVERERFYLSLDGSIKPPAMKAIVASLDSNNYAMVMGFLTRGHGGLTSLPVNGSGGSMQIWVSEEAEAS